MAPAKVLGVERPACPKGHTGTVWLRGRYIGPTGFERTRFTCVRNELDADGRRKRHNFTARFSPRRPADHEHPANDPDFECDVCEREYKRAEGARTPHSNVFSIREIADVLVDIGGGASYRGASRRIRARIERESTRGERVGQVSENANLAIAFLDGFAGVIDAAFRQDHWPHTIVLDSYPFRLEKSPEQREAEAEAKGRLVWPAVARELARIRRKFAKVQMGQGSIFVAVGYETSTGRPVPWLIQFAPSEDEDSWEAFMRLLPGAPVRVVSDRAKAIATAVPRAWPGAEHFACEYHLRVNAEETLLKEGVVQRELADVDPLFRALRVAFWDADRWTAMKELAIQRSAVALLAWIDQNEALVLDQMRRREGVITANGAAENLVLTRIKAAMSGRTSLFRNRARLDKMLALVRIAAAKEDQPTDYSRLLRAHLATTGGRARIDWRSMYDRDKADSIGLAMREAITRHKALQRERNRVRDAPAKAARQRRIQEEYEARRVELGLPPAPRGRPRQIAVGSVTGTFVSDYAWVLADWHPTMNDGLDPHTVKAGSNNDHWWKCPYGPDHEWEATAHNRIMLGHGCPYCASKITARSESLALTHPDIAAEWHPTRNGDRTPYDLTFGSHAAVWWVCARGFKTHDYQTTVRSRTNTKSGCPTCARKDAKVRSRRRTRRRTRKPIRPSRVQSGGL